MKAMLRMPLNTFSTANIYLLCSLKRQGLQFNYLVIVLCLYYSFDTRSHALS